MIFQAKRLEAHAVKQAAAGRWDEILWNLAPSLRTAIDKAPKHVPCPVHGGKNGFRFFPNFAETGAGICNTCGARNDGFAMLMWVNDWSFPEAVEQVGKYLHMEASDQPEIIKTVTDGTKVTGIIASMDTIKIQGRDLFQVTFKNGSVHWGSDLKRAILVADLKVGDRAELTLLSRQFCRRNGRDFKRNLWSAKKLPSYSEVAEKEKEKRELYAERRNTLNQIWKESTPLNLSGVNAASLYLGKRAIKEDAQNPLNIGTDLRLIEALPYKNEEGEKTDYPAMVCAVRTVNGKAVTLHRIYLDGKGNKAPVATPKKLMPPAREEGINGCAIRVGGTVSDVLCIAEGVETALAVLRATGLPCWSAISAGGMKTLEVPESVKTVYIFADKDVSGAGQNAANALKSRLKDKGVKAIVLLPDEDIPQGKKGVDWNDHLVRFGVNSFPI